jgi:glycosyltransferase involved in cell wall biosynthesis
MKKFRRVIVSIYIHPEFYPPTINAILCLSEVCEEVVVVTRNNSLVQFPFPENVSLIKTGKYITPYDSERMSTSSKIVSFLKFTWTFLSESLSNHNDLVLLYDAIPLFSYYAVRLFMKNKTRVWYHNHDMPNINYVRKFSIGWFSAKYEAVAMKHIDYFSLPSVDRLRYYPWLKPQIPFFYFPNYPSLKVYHPQENHILPATSFRLIFQGSIGEHHALEEILLLMKEKINGREMELVLKGPVRETYKNKLTELAQKYNVASRLHWHGIGPYNELPGLTRSCHIGIAIYMGKDEVSKTLGTASNKIYEYAACGLPALLYDNEQFRKSLSSVEWAFFTDGTAASLKSTIQDMLNNWLTISKKARYDFEHTLNFEINFNHILKQL